VIDCTIIIFTKAPVPGKTKTRLIPRIGSQRAAKLHAELVLHTLRTAKQTQSSRMELWCTPSTRHPFFQDCSHQFGITLHTQHGDDLGQRMSHAIDSALQHSRYIILVGTDCPSLTANTLQQASLALQQGHDAVIAPATDGGYVLLGVTRSSPDLFDSIAWGSDSVLQTTRNRLKKLGWRWYELAEHRDIDRPEDLEQLSANQTFRSLLTMTNSDFPY
jgi:hypothetical protein